MNTETPDNEIENISNKCQKSEASEREIMHRKRPEWKKNGDMLWKPWNQSTEALVAHTYSQFHTIETAFIYLVWKFEFEYIAIRFVHTIFVLCAAAIENAMYKEHIFIFCLRVHDRCHFWKAWN